EITTLLNEQATRVGMLAAFDTFVASTNTGDVVFFYYAGHGSQMPDREGDEPSGIDSTLVPVDSFCGFGKGAENLDITDDEIHLRLMELGKRTDCITLIIDACHSGTITRDAGDQEGVGIRGVPG